MNKTILLLLLCTSSMLAQKKLPITENNSQTAVLKSAVQEKLLAAKDFRILNGRMVVKEMPCQISNGNGFADCLVSVICQPKVFKEIGVEKINEMIAFANKKAQNSIDFEHTYIPTEMKIAYNPEINDWCITNLFSVKDKDGKINSSLLAMDFDSNGQFVVMKRVF